MNQLSTFQARSILALGLCNALTLGCTEQPAGQAETQEIIENLRQAGFPADDIMVVDDTVYVGRDAVVSLAASREMLATGTGKEQYRTNNTNNTISTSLIKICVNGSAFTGSTALDLAIQNYDELPLTFSMARTPSSGCNFTISTSFFIDAGLGWCPGCISQIVFGVSGSGSKQCIYSGGGS